MLVSCRTGVNGHNTHLPQAFLGWLKGPCRCYVAVFLYFQFDAFPLTCSWSNSYTYAADSDLIRQDWTLQSWFNESNEAQKDTHAHHCSYRDTHTFATADLWDQNHRARLVSQCIRTCNNAFRHFSGPLAVLLAHTHWRSFESVTFIAGKLHFSSL